MSHPSRILWSVAAFALLLFTLGEALAEEWDVEPVWEVRAPEAAAGEERESREALAPEEVYRAEDRWGPADEEALEGAEDELRPVDEVRGRRFVDDEEDVDEEPPESDDEVETHPTSLPTGEDRSAVTPQALSLPDGGGTIEGMV